MEEKFIVLMGENDSHIIYYSDKTETPPRTRHQYILTTSLSSHDEVCAYKNSVK